MTEAHLKILRDAVAGTLPKQIDGSTSGYSLEALSDLVDEGLMKANRFAPISGPPTFTAVSITLQGRGSLTQTQRKPAGWLSRLWQETSVKVAASVIVTLVLAALAWALA